MPSAAARDARPALPDPADELLDIRAVCRLFGGTKPIDPSTVYKAIRRGVIPRPVYPLPQRARWRRSEVVAALEKRLAGPRREGGSPAAGG